MQENKKLYGLDTTYNSKAETQIWLNSKEIVLYGIWALYIEIVCIVFEYLYNAPQQPWAHRGAFGSISSKKRDKLF